MEQLLGLVLLALRLKHGSQPGGLRLTMLLDSGAAVLGPNLPCFDFLRDKEEFPESHRNGPFRRPGEPFPFFLSRVGPLPKILSQGIGG